MTFLSSIGVTMAPALVGRLISSGAQRIGSLVFQKILRVIKIDHALRSGIVRNPNIQRAVNDFETVIGSRYGRLTERLDSFLKELERTAILTSMFEHALLGRESVELQRLFVTLHNEIIGQDEGDANELYRQFVDFLHCHYQGNN